jgi:cell surface protein SprA
MRGIKQISYIALLFMSINVLAALGGDDVNKRKTGVKAQPKAIETENDSIPDSLLHPRWKIQRTSPIDNSDLKKNSADLKMPDNLKQQVVYNDSIDTYIIGSKIGDSYLNTPIFMSPEEYQQWSLHNSFVKYFRDKNDEEVKAKGKDKFSFSDMKFDLGPAEKIFGPGGVRVKTQGTAELKLGATLKNIDNPSLPIRNRKTTTMDFDEKINLSVNGKVGDKMDMNLNYNTDATFDFDTKNIKLKYEGKEDEVIKLLEGGNITMPSNMSLVKGASSLFGIRADMQFGKLKLQTVVSRKNSTTKSVSSKGGTQLTAFDIDAANYEENRHFFLSQYFRDKYDKAMASLPNLTTGVSISRVEIWVTNKTGTTTNTRNIVGLTDLGENTKVSNPIWGLSGATVPSNSANTEYSQMVSTYSAARDIDQTSTVLDGISGFVGGADYEKLENARLLTSSEYTLNSALGYVSLKTSLQTDQVLAVAYEYTYGGVTYQVGEFAADNTDTQKAIFVKSLKNTSNNPRQGNWDLMMKNVYYLASTVEKEKFKLDIKYQSDTTGVYLTYLPNPAVKDKTLLKVLNCDRLDNNNKAHSNGQFDYVDGYTVSNGRVFFPQAEPFGTFLHDYLVGKGLSEETANKYVFQELYDSTKTVAKQIAEKDKYELVGQYKGTSANVISLGSYNVPQGSVLVTAGGVTLTENTDYTVDYSAGEVTIINQSIIDAGTSVNVSLESNSEYAMQRKTMLGVNWEYDFSKNFQIGGTMQHLSEQTLTSKVNIGEEPLNNTIYGFNVNWKNENQWMTKLLNKIPLLHCTAPSTITFSGEFAKLIAGQASGTQDNASYLDDFENTKTTIDVSTPTSWVISSVPSMFPEHTDITTVASGYNRARLAWYNIDPLFTRRSSSLTPSHIKSDLNQLSNHYVREVYVNELFPNKYQSSYGNTSTLSVLNLAYYPSERGPYNLSTDLNMDGTLINSAQRWGGMMRKLETSDFETSNIEYIEFWMLDPFIYTREQGVASSYSGDLYFNLGEVSEDILHDGKKFYESGMPVDGSSSYTTTQWGKIPTSTTVTYAFATSTGARAKQDVGYNGLTDEEERTFGDYQKFLAAIQGKVSAAVFDSIMADPANDDYHYFRGSDFDAKQTSILDRYKRINNPQGNSPDTDQQTESYDTSYKTTPDVEDINQDYTLNEYEKYYQYRVKIDPNQLDVGSNYIVDKRVTTVTLRNGKKEDATWYQFRIPLDEYEKKVGSISDFSSIRFMRMFMTDFQKPIVLRFATLNLVRGEWRTYNQSLSTTASAESGSVAVSAVSIEENNDKEPVNYIMPPGISRVVDPSQPQLVENNEQALDMVVTNLSNGEAKAVYKNTTLDLRQYKRLQMFVHANALLPNSTNLTDNQLSVFIRLGSDYKSNYYEYDIPLKLTPAGTYDKYSTTDKYIVWPTDNMLNIDMSVFTDVKKARNKAKALGQASYNSVYSKYDDDSPNNKISVMGNPTLGEVKTMIIGVRNNASDLKSGEVWVNELRLKESNNEGGWAALGNLNMQLSDVGTVNMQGKMETSGFGGLEEGVTERSTDNYKEYSVTASVELGKFFPEKAKVTAPLYYSVTKEVTTPKYNPLDTDMKLDDALDACTNEQERDSLKSIAITKTTNTNFSLSNVRVGITTKKHPMPYDPGNFSFSYSHSHKYSSGETTVYEKEDNWRGAMNYSYSPVYKTFEPFRKVIKSKSKWLDILKDQGINYLPQNVAVNSELTRTYYELQERDLESTESSKLPLTFNEQFLWNREFSLRWDFTKNLHMNFTSATHAEIEEPYTPVNKDLYPDHYQAWKDSVWNSIKNWGTPLNYNQTFTLSYQLPINKIPIFDWITSDATYNATYGWTRGTEQEDGTTLGNTIANSRNVNINGNFNLEKLYSHVPFLEETNKRFNKTVTPNNNDQKKKEKKKVEEKKNTKDKNGKDKNAKDANAKDAKNGENKDKNGKDVANGKVADELKKNSRSFVKEILLKRDTTLTINHGKNSKKLSVTARTKEGKVYKIDYKVLDANKILIKNRDSINLKLTVTPKTPDSEKAWYKTAQSIARVLMMVRSASISYRNQYSMSLPGFLPNVGDAFGQNSSGMMAPGLDFAFGLTGDSYINKCLDRDWLLINDSVATPAATNKTEDLQFKVTLEPIKDLKIDLNASRTETKARSIQYMYEGSPTTQSGTFTMTTISLKSAFEGMGDANNGYQSSSFSNFCSSLSSFRDRVEAQYIGATYPSSSTLAGQSFNTANGTVNQYSADVMVPAFLAAYTSGGSLSSPLDIFPALSHMLPNWTIRYSGLTRLPWIRDHFKSVNINHSYKSIYAVGSYSSYSSFMEYMNGLGFVKDATTGNPIPSSMFNVSTVSINEAFSPLLGVDVTFNNNLTCKLEYKTTRVLSLSMTSVQINEAVSHDWVIGMGYKINDFNIFGRTHRKVSSRTGNQNANNKNVMNNKKSGVSNDLNLRLDFSIRNQASICRDIATVTSTASSGNRALKIAFSADYTLSKLLTLSAYYDRQTNTPLLSSSSYPTTTQDFGVSMKFSLTR